MNLIYYTSVVKGLKLTVRKFWGLILMFPEVTEEKLVGGKGGGGEGVEGLGPLPILNKVKIG